MKTALKSVLKIVAQTVHARRKRRKMVLLTHVVTYREQTVACQAAFGEICWAELLGLTVECYYRGSAVDRPITSRLVRRTCCNSKHKSTEINHATNLYNSSGAILRVDNTDLASPRPKST